ncbi:hypothetical protein BDY17DRAFT_131217 [Neohortaea acidophila]|uniref:Uncharacterized protein n=1 Tax=Neohortaea acidophila TaxID=245834 RepID=A0A6A6PXW3_9PEZI|nr:uncharacterized protein BDY17DRAFT_131217 [Neohortaea acidophila]KAF2484574.1 hypothetical protein BDY17DRAFT_131217 [Neohortaea acidophila]
MRSVWGKDDNASSGASRDGGKAVGGEREARGKDWRGWHTDSLLRKPRKEAGDDERKLISDADERSRWTTLPAPRNTRHGLRLAVPLATAAPGYTLIGLAGKAKPRRC